MVEENYNNPDHSVFNRKQKYEKWDQQFQGLITFVLFTMFV